MPRGFFAIGVYHPKREVNIGGLWRSAGCLGASFIFTVGRQYSPQSSDTRATHRHIPLFHYQDMEGLVGNLPLDCALVGVEIDPASRELYGYIHPLRVAYLLGAEDGGLPEEVKARCQHLVVIPTVGGACLNVATAGSVLMYDRGLKARSDK